MKDELGTMNDELKDKATRVQFIVHRPEFSV
jgi:hypothetical protein